MCGIVGSFNVRHDTRLCRDMVSAIKHRGPDDEGVYFPDNGNIFLGHARLSIIDVSSRGHQPMVSSDGRYVIVFNGEVYNYVELRRELSLEGLLFQTSSDTEVLLQAYIRWGERCLERVKGMFAFAIYDHVSRTLLLARDRFGEKPLYYAFVGQGILFASEIKALLASNLVERKINQNRLPEFLAFQSVHHPETLIKNVFLLPPASTMTVAEGAAKITQYWTPSVKPIMGISKTEALQEIRKLLLTSIKNKLSADVPVGVFLSGGIDSSVILGAASRVSNSPVNTFTVAFDDSKFKDGHYSNIVAAAFNANHREIRITYDDVLRDIPAAWNSIDNPSADGLNTFVVSKAVSAAGIKVALSGLGGDEIFGGYSSFKYLKKLDKYGSYLRLIPHAVRVLLADGLINDSASIHQIKMAEVLRSNMSLAKNYGMTRRFFFDFQVSDLFKGPLNFSPEKPTNRSANYTYTAVSILEMDNYMHDVLLKDTDQMSMAHGLEVRVPFLDDDLVNFVLGLSDDFKFNRRYNKSLLIESMREFIPKEVIGRPKQGFVMPIDLWMKGPLREQCEFNLSSLRLIPQLDYEHIKQLWRFFLRGNLSVNWARLWLLNNLGAWVNNNRISA